jgi:hypothetical protein
MLDRAGYMPLRGDNAQLAVALDFSKYQPIKRLSTILWKVGQRVRLSFITISYIPFNRPFGP